MSSLSDQHPDAGTNTRAEGELPPAARSLLRKLGGWSTSLHCASGQLAFGGLSEEPGADGRRHRVSVVEPVDSTLVKALHADGRALVALWIRRPGGSWKFDMAWAARGAGQLAPRRLNSRELSTYVSVAGAELQVAA